MGLFGLVTKKEAMELASTKAVEALATLAGGATGSNFNNAIYQWLYSGNIIPLLDRPLTYVQEGYQGNPDVYSAISLIVTKLAQCPLMLYEVKADKITKVAQYKQLRMSPDSQHKAREILESKAMNETYVPGINDLINNPNPLQTTFDWMTEFASWLLIQGNTYNYYNGLPGYDKTRKFTEMYSLPAVVMQIVSGGVFKPVLGYRVYSNRAYNAMEYDFAGNTVSHLKYFNPYYTTYGSQLYGQAPLRAYLETLQRSKDSRIELNKQAKNGGPIGVWSPKTSAGAPPIDNPKVKSDIKEALKGAHNSSDLASRIIVAAAEGAWTQIGLPSTDLQLIESLGLTTKDICKAFHLPIQALDSSTGATDNNMGWAAKKVVYDAVMPLGGIIEDRLTRDLCKPWEKNGSKLFLMFDYSALPEMQQDQVATATWLSTSYWMTPNEKRAQQGLPASTDPMANTMLVPSTVIPISDLSMTDSTFTQAGNADSKI